MKGSDKQSASTINTKQSSGCGRAQTVGGQKTTIMKKQLFLGTLVLFLSLQMALGQTAQKAASPVFYVSTVEIVCNKGNFKETRKKIHVVSLAMWSVFQNIGLRISDANNTTVASYNTIPGDFYTPPLALTAGASYTITFLDGSGNVMGVGTHAPNPNPYTRVAPACGIELPLGPKISRPVKTKAFE